MITTFSNRKTTLFCLLLLSLTASSIYSQSILFNHFTTNDGLSNNFVTDIIQDRTGFLWLATDDGLNRFDGYEFKIYRNDPDDDNSISDNTVLSLSEDAEGNLWIGTKKGFVNKYDPILDKFTKWEIKSDITKENPINVIHMDKEGLIWIGTYRSGLYRLDPETGKIDHWGMSATDPYSLSNNYVSSIVEDILGNLWIGTFYGLNKLNRQKSFIRFEKYFYEKENLNSLSDNLIWAITQSRIDKNIFYIGTSNGITELIPSQDKFTRIEIGNPDNLQFGTGAGIVIDENIKGEKILWANSFAGLIRQNLTQNQTIRYLPEINNKNSIASYQVNKILKDVSGVLWLSTNKGLSYFSPKKNKINNSFLSQHFNFALSKLMTLSTTAILKTKSNRLFVGTDNGLFYSLSGTSGGELKKHSLISTQTIWSLAEDKKQNVWIGTYGDGLYKFNPLTQSITKLDVLKNIVRSSSRNFIKSLAVDNNNNLWAGTWGVGLAKLNLTTNEIKHFNHVNDNPGSISHDDVWVIFVDSKNRIWIGTNGGGLNVYSELNGGMFYHPGSDETHQMELISNSIYSICESSIIANAEETILWIGTNNGLNKIVVDNITMNKSVLPKIKSIVQFSIKDGLADNSIKTIVEDDKGNLWLGTSLGVSFFDISNNTFTNFNTADGVTGNDFNYSSGIMYDEELIILGSTAGLNYFNPKLINHSHYNPPLVISDFQIFNKSIKPGEHSVLSKSIFNTEKIVISYTQNVFSFLFSALDYNNPSSIAYAYMMEGFDNDWVASGYRRYVTYTNLNPGSYKFKVKSTNSDGIWYDNEKSIRVIITPPWWQTEWAIVLYFIVFVLGIWGIIKFQANRAKLQHELKMREFESYHLKEIEQMKSRFFANLSHEFRTPLLLIKGPLESLLSGKIKENISGYYKILLRNTEKLQQLIDQLLELSQLEAETIPLKVDWYNIVDVIKACYSNFKPLAEEKNINFVFSTEKESVYAMIDKDKLEKIINNLLSNAFKFTPANGSIYLNIRVDENIDNRVIISVKDTGIGIPKEYQNKIFDRFYQVDNSSKRNFGGSGIGLALVKELATLHKWEVNLQSTEGEGTEFVLEIPIQINPSGDSNKFETNIETNIKTQSAEQIEVLSSEHLNTTSINSKEKPLILFVEDNEDVRIYVNDLLKNDYNVLLSDTGEGGIEVTKNDLPDLIISDVMMPGMDGFEFCKRIKSDWKTSHIPVILLTAKVDHQSKLDGLELGADDYITKPFEQKELLIRVKNLIEQRRLLKEKFSKDILLPSESVSYNKEEKELIEKASSIIEKYLGDENFNSEILAQEMFMSRSQLTRKMQSAAAQGPGEFIRNYKLNRSAKMILEKKLSITQIALEVGFGSPAQFTRAFQKHFNCLPSEFVEKAK